MQKVIVYGTLREGQGNWSYLLAPLTGYPVVVEGFKMHSLGGFPGIYYTGETTDTIVGELFEVDEDKLKQLDRLEGYSPNRPATFYDRMELPLNLYCNLKSVETAFIYTYVDAERLQQLPPISDGDWVRYCEEK